MATRRANGDGNIVKLKSGTWRGSVMDGYTSNGKRNIVSFTAPSKSEVLQKMRKYQHDRENDLIIAKSKDNYFSAWADRWYEDHKTQVQASTYDGYFYTLKILKEAFGEIMIDAIRPHDINQFLAELYSDGCSYSKVSKCRVMLIQIFDFAEGNDAVKKNPARFAKSIRNNADFESGKDSFTEEEVELLLAKLPCSMLGHSIRLLLGSGMRVQELLALKAEDINEDCSIIRIRRAVKMVSGKAELGPPKSRSSYRDIPIPQLYRASVWYLKEHGGKEFIWSSGRGNNLHCVGTFRKWYYRALKDVGDVRLLPPHCCRHTYVSRLEEKGIPMEQIAKLVGHSKISTTDVYLHVRANTLQMAVDVLNSCEANFNAMPTNSLSDVSSI